MTMAMNFHGLEKFQHPQSTTARSLGVNPAYEQVDINGIFKNLGMDKFEFSKPIENQDKKQTTQTEAPQIGWARVLFHRFTKDQVQAVNESRQLPKNAKFANDVYGGVRMTWNLADITAGTHKLPAGYELKNDILGFTHVVREGTKSIFLK